MSKRLQTMKNLAKKSIYRYQGYANYSYSYGNYDGSSAVLRCTLLR